MSIIFWAVVGIIVFTTTLWVIKHIRGTKWVGLERVIDPESKFEPNVGWMILIILFSFTPALNIAFFFAGIIVLGIGYAGEDIRFVNPPKWLTFIINILSHEIHY